MAQVPSASLPLLPQAVGCGTHSRWSPVSPLSKPSCHGAAGPGCRSGEGVEGMPRQAAENAWGFARSTGWGDRQRSEKGAGQEVPGDPSLRGMDLTSPFLGRTESWEPLLAPKAGRHTKLPAPTQACCLAVRTTNCGFPRCQAPCEPLISLPLVNPTTTVSAGILL